VIDRRTFLAGTGVVLLAAPLGAEAQQAAKIARIGYLAGNLAANPRLLAELPQDVVCAAVFLCAAESDFITGQTLVVDGGAQMH
jgi:NAD(P)-dependent dehydrogenase (short-subunit alcohol dehydrogenase family)